MNHQEHYQKRKASGQVQKLIWLNPKEQSKIKNLAKKLGVDETSVLRLAIEELPIHRVLARQKQCNAA